MAHGSTPIWSLILAGGDDVRLRPLTTQIVGDARPKRFCPVLDAKTLLDLTRRRVDLVPLTAAVERLATVRVKDVEWSDWGGAERVMRSLARARHRPSWLSRVELASTA